MPGDTTEPAAQARQRVTKKRPEWLVGWSWEHKEAWRALPGGRRLVKEPTRDLFCRSSEGSAPMVARWPDGFCAEIPELVKEQYESTSVAAESSHRSRGNAAFSGTRKKSGAPVTVCYRSERPGQQMYRIFEITFVPLSRFATDDADASAKEVAIALAEAYCADDDMDKEGIQKLREARLPPKIKVQKTKKEVKKQSATTRATPTTTATAPDTAPDPDEGPAASTPAPSPAPEPFHDMRSIPRGDMSDCDSPAQDWSPRTPV